MAENQESERDFRSAETGQYVTEEFAKENPTTTVGEKRESKEEKPRAEVNINKSEVDSSEEIKVEPENPFLNVADAVLEALVIESEKHYLEKIKPFYENQKHIISEIHRRKGLGYMFQDKESGAVLKTIQEDYKTVSLFNLGIHRTRFSDDEAKQSLSNKEAESKGFKLKLGDRRKKK